MIECYYTECQMHSKEEPFCSDNKCTASEEAIQNYAEKRVILLKSIGYKYD